MNSFSTNGNSTGNFDNVEIYNDTKNYYQKKPIDPSKKSIRYSSDQVFTYKDTNSNTNLKTKVKVIKRDIIDTAIFLKKKNLNVLLLNMADIDRPRGCVKYGSNAQEECCFRRSNYFQYLTEEFYPLSGSECVYSPAIEFIKTNEFTGCQMLEEPVEMSVIAMPAPRFPEITTRNPFNTNRIGQWYGKEEDRLIMKEKIDKIFQVGLEHKHDCLVLS